LATSLLQLGGFPRFGAVCGAAVGASCSPTAFDRHCVALRVVAVMTAKLPLIEPVVGERFDDWLQRWAEVEGRPLFAARAAAMHQRLQKESEARKRKAAVAIERVRAGNAGGVVQRRVASWRRPGEFGLITSVFDLGAVTHGRPSYTDQAEAPVTPSCAVTRAGRVTPDQGAGAERREGGEAHLTDDGFKSTTWRAPWGPGYALHRPKSAS
jgi:hypothetical protein